MPRRKQGSRRAVPKGFRSTFEYDVAQELQPSGFTYEPHQIDYTVHRKYTPDFYRAGVLVECKGFFRAGDTQKYKAIRDSLRGQGETLVFVLMKPSQKVSKSTKLTMSQWCDKEGILWYTIETIEELIDYVDARGG